MPTACTMVGRARQRHEPDGHRAQLPHEPEFQAQSANISDTAFVSLMYQNLFGRAPDQGGLENWTNALSHGMSREDVVVNIAKSIEGANHSADTIKIIDHTHTY